MTYTFGKDYVGKELNGFKVLDYKRENRRSFLRVVCPVCKSVKWMRTEQVKISHSCGCLPPANFKDLTGKRFGRLTVIRQTDKRDPYNGTVIWRCLCDCGKYADVSGKNLIRGGVKSCGCLGIENSRKNGKKAGENTKKYCVDGTNVKNLMAHIPKNNKSGVKGVHWDQSRKKWVAQIGFQGKNYYLGRYDELSDAAEARKIAEKQIFGNFLEWYAENYPDLWAKKNKIKKDRKP